MTRRRHPAALPSNAPSAACTWALAAFFAVGAGPGGRGLPTPRVRPDAATAAFWVVSDCPTLFARYGGVIAPEKHEGHCEQPKAEQREHEWTERSKQHNETGNEKPGAG